MAAKSLEQALYTANIDIEIKKALCIGPPHELTERIDKAEKIIIDNLKNEIRDFFAHRIQLYGAHNDCEEIVNDFFKTIFGEKNEH